MLPELVFQNIFYCLHIMICNPLYLHVMAAWKLSYIHTFHQHSKIQQEPGIACLKIFQSKLATCANCMGRHI